MNVPAETVQLVAEPTEQFAPVPGARGEPERAV